MLIFKLAPLAAIALSLAAVAPSAHTQSIEPPTARSAAPAAENSVPRLVQFNGTLKDSAARAVSGVVSVTFALYADQDGGAPLWTETQNVLADANGHYNAVLGVATSSGFPAELFSASGGGSRWLGVTVARQPEMARVLLASVPYALKAADADTLGGRPASEYVTTQQLAERGVGAAPAMTVIAAGGASVPREEGVAAGSEVVADAGLAAPATDLASQPVAQLSGTGTAQYLPLWTSSSALGTSKIYQAKGGFVGINTNTPLLQLDVNGNSIFRGSFQMAPQGVATPSTGQPSHSFQWQGSMYDSQLKAPVTKAFGFRTVPLNNNVPTPDGRLDLFYGVGGGTLNDTGLSILPNGLINFVPGQRFSGGDAQLTGDLAVIGSANFGDISTPGSLTVNTPNVYGVEAITTDKYATSVYAQASGDAAAAVQAFGGLYGIYASGTAYAGQFDGDVQVNGNLAKAGGSFKIDDPSDPAGKYLSHSFVESPDMKNVYDGVVTTDANGFATVTMPAWFESLNRDFRYQLTAIGQFSQAIIAKKIANGQFTIQTDKPNVEVSWQITGIRQDAWANAHRIPVEEEKSSAEKGHFLHPELFGHAGEAGIAAMRPGPDGKLVPVKKTIEAKK
jgi:hypothetical protein